MLCNVIAQTQRDQYNWDRERYELYHVGKNQQWEAGTLAVDTADVNVVYS